MECFPPCPTCTGKCKVQVATRRETTPRKAPEKRGTLVLSCGCTIPASEIFITELGKLGAEYLCEKHGDFFPPKRVKRSRKTKKGDNDVPLF
jgi:hypothetical protein